VHDITELLERTTPDVVPVLDPHELGRRARRRTAARRAAMAIPVTALVALVAATVLPGGGGDGDVVVPAGPHTGAVGGPVGQWRQAAPPPFYPRGDAFTFPTADGRVVVWGGSTPNDGGREGGGTLTDGGVYDPASDTWEPIPPAPVPPGLSFHRVQYAADRLAVLGSHVGGRFHGAVYDVETGAWIAVPNEDRVTVTVDAMAWTGETLVVMRFDRGTDDSGSRLGDWRIDRPAVVRWTFGAPRWVEGSQPPLSLRFGIGTAFDGERIAVWGGTDDARSQDPPRPDQVFLLYRDGAIYDVSSDVWTPIPDAPLERSIHPGLVWHDGRLVAGEGVATLTNPKDAQSRMASYDPSTGEWTPLDRAPAEGMLASLPPTRMAADEVVPLLAVEPIGSPGGVQPRWVFDGVSWRQAPYPDVHRSGATIVATTRWGDTAPGDPFAVQVSNGGGVWSPAPEAPFTTRGGAAVTLLDGRLVVVGGFERTTMEPVDDAWVLDLSP